MNQAQSSNPSALTQPPPSTAPEPDYWLGLPIPPHARLRLAILSGLFIALHSDLLIRTARIAWTDGDWSHAMLVPLFSLYFIFQQRDKIAAAAPRTCWPGLAVMLVGLAGYITGLINANDMLKGYSMIVELFGLALLLTGPGVARLLWFPILYLAFAIKVSPNLWEAIAWQMQLFAAHASVLTLTLIGLDVQVTTTTIELWRGADRVGALNVAEACSGMRMLMTFVALGVAVAYLWERPWWARLIMILTTVPIALLVNVGRVTILGLLFMIDPSYSTGDFHLFIGLLMLAPALGLFLLIGWLLDLFTEPDDTPEAGSRIIRRAPPRESSP